MKAKTLRDRAWNSLSGNWGFPILVMLVSMAIIAAASYAFGVSIILVGPIMVGVNIFFLTFLRNGKQNFGDMFSGFKNFGNNLVGGLLYTLFLILWAIIPIAGLILVFIKECSYSMTLFILADNPGMGGKTALDKSKEMMEGNKARYFRLQLSFFGWWLLCMITCGIMSIWVMPYMQATYAHFYLDLKGENLEKTETDGGETQTATEM